MASDSQRTTGSSPDGSSDHARRAPARRRRRSPDGLRARDAEHSRSRAHRRPSAARGCERRCAGAVGARLDRSASPGDNGFDRRARGLFAARARRAVALRCDSMDLRDVLDGAAFACAATLNERRQALQWTRPGAAIPVRGDRARLTQAVGAVLRSASGAAATGSRIPVRVDVSAGEVVTGIGESAMPASTDSTAARSDARTAARDEPSAPLPKLGLSLAQAIVARHGGALIALDPSRFVIRLPLAGRTSGLNALPRRSDFLCARERQHARRRRRLGADALRPGPLHLASDSRERLPQIGRRAGHVAKAGIEYRLHGPSGRRRRLLVVERRGRATPVSVPLEFTCTVASSSYPISRKPS